MDINISEKKQKYTCAFMSSWSIFVSKYKRICPHCYEFTDTSKYMNDVLSVKSKSNIIQVHVTTYNVHNKATQYIHVLIEYLIIYT